MAMAMAQAAAHSAPPFPLPALPRIRPPPIPKGTPGPNTIPQPAADESQKGRVWADGRWRDPRSSSAKHLREVRSRQLEKALRHETLGMNIYAYRHQRSNQVVYSLTKVMDNAKILKQLLFHGKKTVPSALRRDKWRPYFAIHFPQTPAGAAKGLKVFRDLRELSMQRQLAPPKEMVIATQEDRENYIERTGEMLLETRLNRTRDSLKRPRAKNFVPIPGKRLNPTMVAKRLMNQKMTSVADLAAVLTRHQKPDPKTGKVLSPKEQFEAEERMRDLKIAARSDRYQKRLEKIREDEEETAEVIKTRETMFGDPQSHPISPHALQRIYAEHGGRKLRHIRQSDDDTAKEAGGILTKEERLDVLAAEEELAITEAVEKLVAEIDQRHADRKQDVELAYEAELSSKIAQLNASHSDKNPNKVVLESGKEIHFVAQYADLGSLIQKAQHDIHSRFGQKKKEMLEAYRNGTFDPPPEEKMRSRDLTPSTHAVTVSWSNPGDKSFAPSWPELVTHTSLDAASIAPSANGRRSANPHILGEDTPSNSEDFDHKINYAYPKSIEERDKSRQQVVERAYQQTEVNALHEIINLRQQLIRRRAEIIASVTSKQSAQARDPKNDGIIDSKPSIGSTFTILDQQMLDILRKDLSRDRYPTSHTMFDELDIAHANLLEARLSYIPGGSDLDAQKLEDVRVHTEYIKKYLHYAEAEFTSSPARLNRLAFVRDAVDLINTELERPRGRYLADMKASFDEIIAARAVAVTRLEQLARATTKAEEAAADSHTTHASSEKSSKIQRLEKIISDIDEQHPFPAELLRREKQHRETIVSHQNQISELTETISTQEVEKDQIENQFIAEQKELAAAAPQHQPNTTTTAKTSQAISAVEAKISTTTLRLDKIEKALDENRRRLQELKREQAKAYNTTARTAYWQELVKQNSLGSRTFVDRAVEEEMNRRREAEEAEAAEIRVPDRRPSLMSRIPLVGRFVKQ